MSSGWKVVVADELGITRRAVTNMLRKASQVDEVIECSTVDQGLTLLEQGEPTLLLVDLKAPGLDLVSAARERCPGLKIVVLTGYDQPEDALEALRAGADGFLVKGMLSEELMTCLNCVVDTGVVVTSRVFKKALYTVAQQPPAVIVEPSRVQEQPLDEPLASRLTLREREIFDLMARAFSNKEIAAELHIAEQTVKVHVSRILAKLGQPNRAQAVIHGLRPARNGH